MRKGESGKQVPTLWHMGFGKPFDVMRKRKGDKRWRRVGYKNLTRASARRWWCLSKNNVCIVRRDVQREVWISALNPNNWHEVK